MSAAEMMLVDAFTTDESAPLWVDVPQPERVGWARSYCSSMWGEHTGVAAFAVGTGQHYTATGKYEPTSFRARFVAWPAGVDALAELVALADDGADVYVAPMLRTAPPCQKHTGAGGRFAWADVDGPLTVERRAVLATLGSAVRLVSSGGGHHAYVELDGWHDPEVVEAANRGLRDALDADHKWANNALLRLPGTWNWKRVTSGEGPRELVQKVVLP